MRASLQRQRIDPFDDVGVASGRRRGPVPEGGAAGDAHRGTDRVVDRAPQAAACVLHARLVDRSRRERREVVGGDGVIGVVERLAAADVVQSTDVARIRAADVVQVVAELQPGRAARLVIDASEHVGGVVAGRVVAGREARTAIADGIERRVDRRHGRRRDCDDRREVALRSLDVAEPEGAILRDRSSEAESVLVLLQRILARCERVLRVERVVAKEFVRAPAVAIRPRLRDEADDAGRRPAEFGRAAGGYDLELAHDFFAQRDAREIGGVVVGGKAVHDEVVVQIALAADGNARRRHRRRFREPIRVAQVGARHVRREQGEVEIVPAVQRQRVDFMRGDRRRDLRPPRLGHVRHGFGRLFLKGDEIRN